MPVTPEQAAEALASGRSLWWVLVRENLFEFSRIAELEGVNVVSFDSENGWYCASDHCEYPLADCHLTDADAWRAEAARIRALVPEVEAMAAEAERRADGAK